MKSQITLRREQIRSEDQKHGDDGLGSNTIFDNIIRAGEDDGKFAFDESEVKGNTFAMLFAGHGTRSNLYSARRMSD